MQASTHIHAARVRLTRRARAVFACMYTCVWMCALHVHGFVQGACARRNTSLLSGSALPYTRALVLSFQALTLTVTLALTLTLALTRTLNPYPEP